LCREIKLMPQALVNVSFSGDYNPLNKKDVLSIVNQVENKLAGRGRVLLRKSGTEPLIRIMVEGENENQVTAMANCIANAIK
ncbi:MAG: phosphoglucosamine mutase, partial [Arsenophonus sp. NC-QC1-MAG3]